MWHVLDQGQCAECRRHFTETYDPSANSIDPVTFFSEDGTFFLDQNLWGIGSTRLKKPQSARCCGIFGKTSQGMQRLMEVLGDVSESVPEGQTHAEENEDSMEQPAGNSDSMVTPSANEGSDHRNNDPLKSSQAEAAEADGLMHWDEIENTGEPDNGDAFAQLAAMASGMFSAEPDETDN